jgi:dienelactone hydrolase
VALPPSFLTNTLRTHLLLALLLLGTLTARAQPRTPADFGYRHLTMRYERDTVDILVLSKKGEEMKRKPVFFFAQGSLPRPIILYDDKGPYRPIPIQMDSLLARCHLVIVSKPGIPLTGDVRQLGPGGTYADPKTGLPPAVYCQRNYLEYYVRRNAAVLRFLQNQPWANAADITAMGHSEGAPIVARMARHPTPLRRVIYLNGSSLGRMLTMTGSHLDDDTTGTAANFQRWQQIVAAPQAYDCAQPGDSPLTTASFSEAQTPIEDFRHCRILVFVGYGTRDPAAISNDYLRLEMIRAKKGNFAFHLYPGVEHNFFGFTNGQVDYDKGHWDQVAQDFLAWMKSH